MLTPEEQAELAALEQEEAMETGLTPEEAQELAMLEQEELMAQPKINPYEEADLGFSLRSRYAIEPLETNRMALLQKELGQENVKVDQSGNVFVNTDGEFKPVNIEGISAADIADIAGATPEMIGTVAGAAIGGVTSAGAASVPAAMAGGAIGSAGRQAISAMLGTPQEAGIAERAAEVGLSAGLAGAGAVAAKGAKTVGKKIFPKLSVNKAFEKTAKRIGVDLTDAQKVGGRLADLEKAQAETPIFGRGIRKKIEKQISQIKDNLGKQFGEFTDVDYDNLGAGNIVKNKVQTINQGIKDEAVRLFDDIAAKGQNVTVRSNVLKKSLSDKLNKIGIIDEDGFAKKFNAKSGLTRDQFDKVQRVTLDIIDGIDETAKMNNGLVNANEINTLRKSIDQNIREVSKMGYDDKALKNLRESFMDLTEDMLGAQSKKLKKDFITARGLYSKYLKNKNIIEKDLKLGGTKELADEKTLNRIFQDTETLDKFIQLSDESTAKEAADNFIKDLLSKKLGKDDQISARGALKTIREKRGVLRKALGVKDYNQLVDNLNVLDQIGKSINPSQTAVTQLRTDVLKGLGIKAQQITGRAGRPITRMTSQVLPYATPIASEPVSRDITSILRGE